MVSVGADGSIGLDVAPRTHIEKPSPAHLHETVRLADIGNDEGWRKASLRPALDALTGRRIAVHPIYPKLDRWGRAVGHIEVLDGESSSVPGFWLQAELVRAGLVEVRPQGSGAGCAAALYEGEEAARREKRGIWGGAEIQWGKHRQKTGVSGAVREAASSSGGAQVAAILSASDAQLTNHANGYRIVAGIVVSVGETSRTLYLNFGRDWSRDFTVTIPAGREDAFREAGRNPKALAGRYVRVRGWMKEWNGAQIEIRHPDQIEVF